MLHRLQSVRHAHELLLMKYLNILIEKKKHTDKNWIFVFNLQFIMPTIFKSNKFDQVQKTSNAKFAQQHRFVVLFGNYNQFQEKQVPSDQNELCD